MNLEDIFSIVESHDLDKLEQWIAKGFDANHSSPNSPYWTPLQDAVDELDYNSSMAFVERLLEAGADPSYWDPRSSNGPLMMAITRRHSRTARLLLEYGADPNVRSSEGTSPLRWSVQKDDLEMVSLLIDHGLSANSINDPGGIEGMNALGIATSRLNEAMVRMLTDAGADPTCKDANLRNAEDIIPPDADPKIQSQLRNYLLNK